MTENIITLPAETVSEPLPVGQYDLRFIGCEQVPANLEKGYKAAVRFNFEVSAGPFSGRKTSRFCGLSSGSKAILPNFLTALMGQQPKPGAVDVSPFIGKQYKAQVAKSPNGESTRVESVFLL